MRLRSSGFVKVQWLGNRGAVERWIESSKLADRSESAAMWFLTSRFRVNRGSGLTD